MPEILSGPVVAQWGPFSGPVVAQWWPSGPVAQWWPSGPVVAQWGPVGPSGIPQLCSCLNALTLPLPLALPFCDINKELI